MLIAVYELRFLWIVEWISALEPRGFAPPQENGDAFT